MNEASNQLRYSDDLFIIVLFPKMLANIRFRFTEEELASAGDDDATLQLIKCAGKMKGMLRPNREEDPSIPAAGTLGALEATAALAGDGEATN